MRILFASLALLLAACASSYQPWPPSVPLPPELTRREMKDRAAIIVDVRDVDGVPAHDAVVTLRMVLSGSEWPDVPLKSAGHYRYVDVLHGGTYRIDVTLPGRRSEHRTLSYGGEHRFERFWMLLPEMRGYHRDGMRWPVTYDGPPELVAETRGDRERVVAAARELGMRVMTRRPAEMRDELVILRLPSVSDSLVGTLGHELARRTGAAIYYVVEHGDRFVAVSRAVHATLRTHPDLPGVRTRLAALGFDTTAVHNYGSGLWRLRWGSGPNARLLDAVDSLERGGAAVRIEHDLLQVREMEPLE